MWFKDIINNIYYYLGISKDIAYKPTAAECLFYQKCLDKKKDKYVAYLRQQGVTEDIISKAEYLYYNGQGFERTTLFRLVRRLYPSIVPSTKENKRPKYMDLKKDLVDVELKKFNEVYDRFDNDLKRNQLNTNTRIVYDKTDGLYRNPSEYLIQEHLSSIVWDNSNPKEAYCFHLKNVKYTENEKAFLQEIFEIFWNSIDALEELKNVVKYLKKAEQPQALFNEIIKDLKLNLNQIESIGEYLMLLDNSEFLKKIDLKNYKKLKNIINNELDDILRELSYLKFNVKNFKEEWQKDWINIKQKINMRGFEKDDGSSMLLWNNKLTQSQQFHLKEINDLFKHMRVEYLSLKSKQIFDYPEKKNINISLKKIEKMNNMLLEDMNSRYITYDEGFYEKINKSKMHDVVKESNEFIVECKNNVKNGKLNINVEKMHEILQKIDQMIKDLTCTMKKSIFQKFMIYVHTKDVYMQDSLIYNLYEIISINIYFIKISIFCIIILFLIYNLFSICKNKKKRTKK